MRLENAKVLCGPHYLTEILHFCECKVPPLHVYVFKFISRKNNKDFLRIICNPKAPFLMMKKNLQVSKMV